MQIYLRYEYVPNSLITDIIQNTPTLFKNRLHYPISLIISIELNSFPSNHIHSTYGIPQVQSETPYSLFCSISPNTKLMQRIISSAARAASKSAIQS